MEKASRDKLKDNLMFVGTIYDSFEALEGQIEIRTSAFYYARC